MIEKMSVIRTGMARKPDRSEPVTAYFPSGTKERIAAAATDEDFSGFIRWAVELGLKIRTDDFYGELVLNLLSGETDQGFIVRAVRTALERRAEQLGADYIKLPR
jgi:hypothetical protein